MTTPAANSGYDADGDPKILNTAPRIIGLVVLPIVFIAFMILTLSGDHFSSVIFGAGVAGMLLVELGRRVFYKRSVGSDLLKDSTTSLSVSLITGLMNNLFVIPVAFVWMTFVSNLTPLHLQQRIADLFDGSLKNPYAIAITLAIALVCADFLYYWAHRGGHRVELLWGSHSVHHSSEHFNPTTATRIAFLDEFWDLCMMSVMCLLGLGPLYALGAYALVLLWQLPIHQTWRVKLPRWYEFFFNTPSHHRAHHAFQKIYIDRNFGGITIIWDRIFKSFQEVEEATPPAFGLTVPVGTYNPFKVLFIELGHMGKNVRHAKSFGEACGYVFKQPYWKPADAAK
jgi:sterol desaturase/sphingolipid hydroxylase (fatty acid hydroxylase superfamily)